MGFTAVAVLGGIVLGLICGGRPSNLAAANLRWPLALTVGVIAQWVPELLDASEGTAFGLVVLSYVALAAFAIANLRMVGMPVVLVGLVLNMLVIGLNGGMPVRSDAVLAAGLADTAEEVERMDFGAKRHLEDDDDVLTLLGDVVPVRALGEVLSFGDLVLSVGVADLLFRLLKPVRGRRRRTFELPEHVSDAVVIDLRSEPVMADAPRVAS